MVRLGESHTWGGSNLNAQSLESKVKKYCIPVGAFWSFVLLTSLEL
jgi:hypothetical protein